MLSSQITKDTFSGVWTALATPFNKDLSIDIYSWEKIIAYQSSAGVRGVVVAGSTGEGSTLSVNEKLSLIKKAKAILPTTVKLMANVGGSVTEQSVELAKLSEEAGADSLLVVTPPYIKPSLAGLKYHFQTIADAVSIPICLYHVPSRTGQTLDSTAMKILCQINGVELVKEASGDLNLYSDFIVNCKATFLSGDDLSFLPSLAIGGSGLISVTSNIYPKEMVYLNSLFENGKNYEASKLHQNLFPVFKSLFIESSPGPLKKILSLKGLCSKYLRPPLREITKESEKSITASIKDFEFNLSAH